MTLNVAKINQFRDKINNRSRYTDVKRLSKSFNRSRNLKMAICDKYGENQILECGR